VPDCHRKESRRTRLGVPAEHQSRLCISFGVAIGQRPFEIGSRQFQVALEERNHAKRAASHAGFHRTPLGLRFLQRGFGSLSRQAKVASNCAPEVFGVISDKALDLVFGWPRELS
jgi:hypothetical protein